MFRLPACFAYCCRGVRAHNFACLRSSSIYTGCWELSYSGKAVGISTALRLARSGRRAERLADRPLMALLPRSVRGERSGGVSAQPGASLQVGTLQLRLGVGMQLYGLQCCTPS